MPVQVLLIEDNVGDARLIQQITSQSTVPIHTAVAESCVSALAMLADGRYVPNLVITDMSVSDAAAPELLKRCNATGVPVVVFSASMNPVQRAEALRLGAKEFVEKPYGIDEYTAALWNLISRWTAGEA
jgi:two-component system KDP operon response regulator KdpE